MGSGEEGKWWRREVVTMGSGEEGKWWRREVVTKGSGDEGKWWRREVVTKGSGEVGKWWRREVVTKGSGRREVVTMGCGDDGKWWRREVVRKGSGEEGKWTKGGGDDGMWWRWEVMRKGSGDEARWWRWDVVRKGSGDEGKWWVGEEAGARNLVFFRVKWLQPGMKATSSVRRLRLGSFCARIVPRMCFATSGCVCVRRSMRFLNLWLKIALELLHDVAWAVCWGGSRSTKPCVFPCKVAAAGDESYLVGAAVAAGVVLCANCSSYVYCNEWLCLCA